MKRTKVSSKKNNVLTFNDLAKFTEEVLLPGVETIVDKAVAPVNKHLMEMDKRLTDGLTDVNKSVRSLSGDIIELKVREEEQKHEERISRIERKLSVR